MQQYIFAAIALLMIFAALRLVTTKNVFHGALWLLLVLAGVAAAFILLMAEFVAWVQVLIYVGAVLVLLLFGLMLTRAPIGRAALDNERRGVAALVAGGIFLVTSWVILSSFEGMTISFDDAFETTTLGEVLFTRFVLPFEVVSVLLLAALIGAVVLSRKD